MSTDLVLPRKERPRRPILRYHGGKWRLAPWIISHFPPHRMYTEAYGGAASVLLQKRPSFAEVYNDKYGEVVDLFRVVRDPDLCTKLKQSLELTPFAKAEFIAAADRSPDPVENARRMIVRSFQGFGADSVMGQVTGFRAQSSGSSVSPAVDWSRFAEILPAVCHRLLRVVIDERHAFDVLRDNDSPTALHYVDPPYVHLTRSMGNPYCKKHLYAFEMTDDDHRELAEVLKGLRGAVVLSGYPSELYKDLFESWEVKSRRAFSDGAGARTECLWLNDHASQRRQPELIVWTGGGNDHQKTKGGSLDHG